MLGLFFLFFLVGLVVFFMPSISSNKFVWMLFYIFWVGYLIFLGDVLVPRKYRYVVKVVGGLFLVFALMVLFEGRFPYLGVWGNIFVGSVVLYHGMLLRGLDNLLRRASVASFLWFVVHNLVFISTLVWFIVFERFLPWLWFGAMVLGLVSLVMGLRKWRKRSGITVRVVDVSSIVVLAALYIVLLAIAVRVVYVFHLDQRLFWTILLSAAMVLLGLWFIFGGGMRKFVRSAIDLMLGGKVYDPIKEWDDFVSDIEDVIDEDEISDKVDAYFRKRFGFLFTKIFWRDEVDDKAFVSKKGEKIVLAGNAIKYLWYKDSISTAEELWRMGAEIRSMEEGDLVIPMIFQKRLVGIIIQRPSVSVSLPVELIYMLSRNIALMMTLAKLSSKIIEMSKFEQFNKVVSFVMHDIKNVLSSLSVLLENWRNYGDDPEFIKGVFLSLQAMESRVQIVVDRLTKFRNVKRETGEKILMEPIGLRGVIESVLADLQVRLSDVSLDIGQIDAVVLAERQGLSRVIENLILNAVESMEGKEKKVLSVWIEEGDGFINLFIRDTGIGMDEEFLQKDLFRPFVSTKKNGIGIGMYEVKSFLQEIGAGISVVSQRQVGTTVVVRLKKGDKH